MTKRLFSTIRQSYLANPFSVSQDQGADEMYTTAQSAKITPGEDFGTMVLTKSQRSVFGVHASRSNAPICVQAGKADSYRVMRTGAARSRAGVRWVLAHASGEWHLVRSWAARVRRHAARAGLLVWPWAFGIRSTSPRKREGPWSSVQHTPL